MVTEQTYKMVIAELKNLLGSSKVYTDPLYTLAKGTDAGFYRLIPKVVVTVDNEEEALGVIKICGKHNTPITFKAGGTSLSGQTITNSVLMEITDSYSHYKIDENGEVATFQCGLRGGLANHRLIKYGKQLGPSPASINSARISGIVSNNASGAGYGIVNNSYNTVVGMRLIMHDGTILDTKDETSRKEFVASHPQLIQGLKSLSDRIKSNPVLRKKIEHKFEIKNTTGYGINSLIDTDDPINMIQRLMIGSEGTLAFISDVTFRTVENHRLKATSLIFFHNIRVACSAITPLRRCEVSAAELMDRNALRSVQAQSGMQELLEQLDEEVVALLIETSANRAKDLQKQIEEIEENLSPFKTVHPIQFTTDRIEYNRLWRLRKGLFTSAAAPRPTGTACIIEDVAFRADVLADALEDLKLLIERYGYKGYVIWGHLLDGNIHFVLMPDFNTTEGVDTYALFMEDLVDLVVHKYDGSLKAEHGTGRNMAPFVKAEWGDELYEAMKEVKNLLDPNHILNPGVVINDDPQIHLKNFKPLPPAHEIIDKCIECGFCESACPSHNLTLTPRQRIVVYREMTRLQRDGVPAHSYKEFADAFQYNVDDSCATDGLCALNCPVEIDTGTLVKELRMKNNSKAANAMASWMARNMKTVTRLARGLLSLVSFTHLVIGTKMMRAVTSTLRKISFNTTPAWNPHMPTASPYLKTDRIKRTTSQNKVVYFPSCINRTMGNSRQNKNKPAVVNKTISLLEKAGYEIVFPNNLHNLCCGMAFNSKGFKKQGHQKSMELEKALLEASENGKYPVYSDMSPCLFHMKGVLSKRLELHDPVSFIMKRIKDKLIFTPIEKSISIHSTCSNTKMGQTEEMIELAKLCATEVIVPDEVDCCGWAGDRGFTHPELTASALKSLRKQTADSTEGYSTSRTCEIGLTLHSNINYESIIYLVDDATKPKV